MQWDFSDVGNLDEAVFRCRRLLEREGEELFSRLVTSGVVREAITNHLAAHEMRVESGRQVPWSATGLEAVEPALKEVVAGGWPPQAYFDRLLKLGEMLAKRDVPSSQWPSRVQRCFLLRLNIEGSYTVPIVDLRFGHYDVCSC